jgi:hypothetical protein
MSKVESRNGDTYYTVGFTVQESYDDGTLDALDDKRLNGEYVDIFPTVRAHYFEMELKPDAGIVVLGNGSNFGNRDLQSSTGTVIAMQLTLNEAGAEFIEAVMEGRAKFSDKFEVRACFEVDAAVPRTQAEIDADPGPYVFTVKSKRVTKCAVMEQ